MLKHYPPLLIPQPPPPPPLLPPLPHPYCHPFLTLATILCCPPFPSLAITPSPTLAATLPHLCQPFSSSPTSLPPSLLPPLPKLPASTPSPLPARPSLTPFPSSLASPPPPLPPPLCSTYAAIPPLHVPAPHSLFSNLRCSTSITTPSTPLSPLPHPCEPSPLFGTFFAKEESSRDRQAILCDLFMCGGWRPTRFKSSLCAWESITIRTLFYAFKSSSCDVTLSKSSSFRWLLVGEIYGCRGGGGG